jgi:hypothetical protein
VCVCVKDRINITLYEIANEKCVGIEGEEESGSGDCYDEFRNVGDHEP